jgi:hypothetical protein
MPDNSLHFVGSINAAGKAEQPTLYVHPLNKQFCSSQSIAPGLPKAIFEDIKLSYHLDTMARSTTDTALGQ